MLAWGKKALIFPKSLPDLAQRILANSGKGAIASAILLNLPRSEKMF
ncbi:hypothetical protein PN462_09425 [Spirulina sp. CS-785/01]|nr:hypothetical protein [Spirulina sp. CS-785/01]MDB9313318.1 hypothetical protein [Spirulina sp. CS-785/01]